MLVLHALPTGLPALHDPVSQYGITTYRLGFRVLIVAMGAAFWLLVVGLVGLFLTGRASSRRRFPGACEHLVYAGIYLLLAATGILLI